MLTPDIKKQFTAAEALSFLETLLSQLDSKTLAQQLITQSLIAWKHWDHWEGFPDDSGMRTASHNCLFRHNC